MAIYQGKMENYIPQHPDNVVAVEYTRCENCERSHPKSAVHICPNRPLSGDWAPMSKQAAPMYETQEFTPKPGDLIVIRSTREGFKGARAFANELHEEFPNVTVGVLRTDEHDIEKLDPEMLRAAGWVRQEEVTQLCLQNQRLREELSELAGSLETEVKKGSFAYMRGVTMLNADDGPICDNCHQTIGKSGCACSGPPVTGEPRGCLFSGPPVPGENATIREQTWRDRPAQL